MRAGSSGWWVGALWLLACTPETERVILTVPSDPVAWLFAARAPGAARFTLTIQDATDDAPLYRAPLADDPGELWALGLSERPAGLGIGTSTLALVPEDATDLALLPLSAARVRLRLRLDPTRWETVETLPEGLAGLAARSRQPVLDCLLFEEVERDRTFLTSGPYNPTAIFGWPLSATETLVGTEVGVYRVSRTAQAPLYEGRISWGTQDPDGNAFLATDEGIWAMTVTATAVRRTRVVSGFGPEFSPRVIAAHRGGRFHALSGQGVLRYWDGQAWLGVLQTGNPLPSSRRFLLRIGSGPDDDEIAVGDFTEPQFYRGRGQNVRLAGVRPPSGFVSGVIRHPSGHLLVMTTSGLLLDERTGFAPVPGGLAYAGITFRAGAPFRGGLMFGGDTGTFGYLSSENRFCRRPTPITPGVRLILPLGDGLLLSGAPKEIDPERLTIHRFDVRPDPGP